MKKILSIMMLLVLSAALYAQKEVTKFLGIPVDGTKAAMIQKLKAKGFTPSLREKDMLVGTFNGAKVNVYIVTNKGKVCRIMVCDANTMNETDIRIRFNTLCRQFNENKKYISASLSDYILQDSENISHGMTLYNKRYEAAYYQLPSDWNETVASEMESLMLSKYTKEELANITEDQKKELLVQVTMEMLGKLSKRSVWFMISEHYGQYYISMFYDNEYNRANGEDL
ncbi:MAG: hypothetical protein IJY03_05425 [Prevotella sp.]|nr:hypothetical protein [Prevotella sp.]